MNTQANAPGAGYLALPASGTGPGVIVLHAWWGLNDFFRELCDRLAAEGFVAYAPDLYAGRTASTIEDAERLLESADDEEMRAAALGAVELLRGHAAVRAERLGAIGFSLGAAYAITLSELRPAEIGAVVLFYGAALGEFEHATAAYLGHFAANDPWEPDEGVRLMEQRMRAAGRRVSLHTYTGAGHWFCESNRPDDYDAGAAELAWRRTIAFLKQEL